MGIRIQKRKWRNCLLLRISGRIGYSDCPRIYEYLRLESTGGMGPNLFYDLEEVSDIDMTFAEMNQMINLRRQLFNDSNGIRIAIWAPSDITFGMSRMYAALLAQFATVEIDVLRTRKEAARFLDLPQDVLDFKQPADPG